MLDPTIDWIAMPLKDEINILCFNDSSGFYPDIYNDISLITRLTAISITWRRRGQENDHPEGMKLICRVSLEDVRNFNVSGLALGIFDFSMGLMPENEVNKVANQVLTKICRSMKKKANFKYVESKRHRQLVRDNKLLQETLRPDETFGWGLRLVEQLTSE
jgi:hypothetical protein